MNRLIEIGFQSVGLWKLVDGQPVCELTSQVNTPNILYAFVSSGEIKYIGKTTQTLKARMTSYQSPGPTQSTNIKNNKNIKTLLQSGKAVDIFILPDTGLLHYGKYHINLAAGLEDSLISEISPAWNGKYQEPESSHSKFSTREKNVAKIPTSMPNETQENIIGANSNNPTFHFYLRTTYFNTGFFNVPVKYMNPFGRDKKRIEIFCGESQDLLILGTINRSANATNAPRIMGGAKLRRWFQKNFKIDNLVIVEVLSPTSIWLRRNRT